jgi:hypothetical protein
MWVEHCSHCYTNDGYKRLSPKFFVFDVLTGRESTILQARVDYLHGTYPRERVIENARFICWLTS